MNRKTSRIGIAYGDLQLQLLNSRKNKALICRTSGSLDCNYFKYFIYVNFLCIQIKFTIYYDNYKMQYCQLNIIIFGMTISHNSTHIVSQYCVCS